MPAKMITMVDLRGKLFNAIDDVATGDLEPARAQAIAKLAAQLNQSLLTEIEIQKLQILNKMREPFGIGNTPIAELAPLIETKAGEV